MKIVIDKDKCMGCNLCEEISDGIISAKNGRAEVIKKEALTKEGEEKVRLAAEVCPQQAIKIVED